MALVPCIDESLPLGLEVFPDPKDYIYIDRDYVELFNRWEFMMWVLESFAPTLSHLEMIATEAPEQALGKVNEHVECKMEQSSGEALNEFDRYGWWLQSLSEEDRGAHIARLRQVNETRYAADIALERIGAQNRQGMKVVM